MRGNQVISLWGRAAAVTSLGVLLFAAGCAGAQTSVRAQALAADQPGTVVMSCEPNQRTVVRPSIVNGAAVSQVECVTTGQPLADAPSPAMQPAPASYSAAAPRTVQAVANPEFADARVIPADRYPVSTARPVRAQQVVYDDRPVRVVKRGRSLQKSAIIVGSSAGAGAGIGAAVGGKKGALLGAVLGGGGAAIWDQITRRK